MCCCHVCADAEGRAAARTAAQRPAMADWMGGWLTLRSTPPPPMPRSHSSLSFLPLLIPQHIRTSHSPLALAAPPHPQRQHSGARHSGRGALAGWLGLARRVDGHVVISSRCRSHWARMRPSGRTLRSCTRSATRSWSRRHDERWPRRCPTRPNSASRRAPRRRRPDSQPNRISVHSHCCPPSNSCASCSTMCTDCARSRCRKCWTTAKRPSR